MDKNRKLCVVTGASDGIGYELAKVFAEKGYDLVVCAEDKGIIEAAQAFEGLGAKVTSVQADLATHEGCEDLWRRVKALGRPVDVVCLNAGVGAGGRFAEIPLEKEANIVQLNCMGTIHVAKLAVKDMLRRGEGKILVTSSVVSTIPGTYSAVYGASKAFTHSFAEALRSELDGTGVTVTSLRPGATETNFFHRADMDDTKVGQAEKDDPADVAKDGYEALMAGKHEVVAGSLKNAVQVQAGKLMPDPAKAAMHKKQAEPGSANK